MMNKEFFNKIATKIEQALVLMCIYLFCVKILNWFKTLYVGDFNLFKNIIISIAVVSIIIFFAVTKEKTHNVAKHITVIYCGVCTYLHFDALMANWLFAIPFCFFAGVALISTIQGPDFDNNLTESKREEKIIEDDNFTAAFMTCVIIISQLVFWFGSWIAS